MISHRWKSLSFSRTQKAWMFLWGTAFILSIWRFRIDFNASSGIWMLLGTAGVLLYHGLRQLPQTPPVSFRDRIVALVILGAAWFFLLAVLFLHWDPDWIFYAVIPLALWSIGTRIGGLSGFLGAPLPAALLFPGMAFADFINSLASYPLRVFSAAGAGEVIRFFGGDITISGADLTFHGAEIAVTPSCSGIEQLEALIFIGTILVFIQHDCVWKRFIHMLSIVPILLVCNILRLMINLWLYVRIGKEAFTGDIHLYLGYAMIVAATGLFYLLGIFLSPTAKKTKESTR